MSFQFSDQHIDDYPRLGYTVFRGILPPSLIDDLRRVTDRGRELARELHGPQSQRLQPIGQSDLDLKPFEDYRDLPELRDAVSRVLTPNHRHGNIDIMGVLYEPADEPWCTQWHRDWRDNVSGLDIAAWEAVYQDIDLFNQINCALYEDSSTWVVPGSHLRRDLPREIARFPERPITGPELGSKSSAEREYLCLEYCHSMPGAEQLLLDAGDFALYRNSLWHLGNDVPYRKRATLHDSGETAKFTMWRDATIADSAKRREAGIYWENPNSETTAISSVP